MVAVLDPVALAGLQLASRVVRSATAERILNETDEESALLAERYVDLARGGVGLIVSGHIAVDPTGKTSRLMPGLFSDDQIPRWRRVVEAAHEAGGVIAAQINHAGGRAKPDIVGAPPGPFGGPVCVSRVTDRGKDALDGAELDDAGVETLIERYGAAARRAREAGFDAVQIHAAHGYLGSQFLSPRANRRADRWGGSLENRARFLRGVIAAVRREVGRDFPLGMKLGAMDDEGDGALTVEESVQAAQWFEQDGLDFIEISGAFHAGVMPRHIKPGKGEAYYVPAARRFKAALRIPVIAVGGFRALDSMNEALQSGACDAIAMSRPLIRRPDLPRALRRGGSSECLSCNLCLLRGDAPTRCHSLP